MKSEKRVRHARDFPAVIQDRSYFKFSRFYIPNTCSAHREKQEARSASLFTDASLHRAEYLLLALLSGKVNDGNVM